MGGSFKNSPERYNKDVIRYKTKYTRFRIDLKPHHIRKGLSKFGYLYENLRGLLIENSSNLTRVIEQIVSQTPLGIGRTSTVFYMGVVSELLDMIGIQYDIHVGFVLPVKVSNPDEYKGVDLVNYMYIVSQDGVAYHYFNGITDSTDFTFIKDNIVEV